MRHLRTIIVWSGLLLVVVINLGPDLSYKGMYHPVGVEAVQAFQATLDNHDFEQPVWRWGGDDGLLDTGQWGQTWLRNDYRDPYLLAKLNLTLMIIGFFIFLYLLAGLVVRPALLPQRQLLRTS